MNRILKYAKGYYKYCILSPLFIVIEALLEIFIPLVMMNLIDIGIKMQNMNYIVAASCLIIGMSVLALIGGCGSGYFATKASAGLGKNIRKALYDKVQTFSFENIDKFSTASLVTRLTQDVTNVQTSFQMTIRICFRAPLLFVAALVMTCIESIQVGIIFLCIVPLLLIIVFIVIMIANKYFKQMFKKIDQLNLVVQENVNAIRTVKSYTNEDYESSKFLKASKDVRYFSCKAEALGALFNPVSQFLLYTSYILIIFFACTMMVGDKPTMLVGKLQLFINYGSQILSSLMMACVVFMMIIMSRASKERILAVLDEIPTIVNPADPIMKVDNGSVEFKNVNFSYSNDMSKLAIKNMSFKINSGETVGIFGPTGSSKTTLISLIDRLYDVSSGEVFVGNHNVKDYDLFTLRESCSVVLQKNTLFSGTINSNMRWGNPTATDEEIKKACNYAQASEFIEKLDDKYNSTVEEGGVNFSGGQKQRLCIARAILKKPQILILDDSTSAVDTKTDLMIREAFIKEIPHTTKFIISQRISSIMNADKIIILNNGSLVDIGNHNELMKRCKEYEQIFNAQMKASPRGGNL